MMKPISSSYFFHSLHPRVCVHKSKWQWKFRLHTLIPMCFSKDALQYHIWITSARIATKKPRKIKICRNDIKILNKGIGLHGLHVRADPHKDTIHSNTHRHRKLQLVFQHEDAVHSMRRSAVHARPGSNMDSVANYHILPVWEDLWTVKSIFYFSFYPS
jgi:hypothetical protein